MLRVSRGAYATFIMGEFLTHKSLLAARPAHEQVLKQAYRAPQRGEGEPQIVHPPFIINYKM
jgi:hypothetical protein